MVSDLQSRPSGGVTLAPPTLGGPWHVAVGAERDEKIAALAGDFFFLLIPEDPSRASLEKKKKNNHIDLFSS